MLRTDGWSHAPAQTPHWPSYHYETVEKVARLGTIVHGPVLDRGGTIPGAATQHSQVVFSTEEQLHARASYVLDLIASTLGLSEGSEWHDQRDGYRTLLRWFFHRSSDTLAWITIAPYKPTSVHSVTQTGWKQLADRGLPHTYRPQSCKVNFGFGLPDDFPLKRFRFLYRLDAVRAKPQIVELPRVRIIQAAASDVQTIKEKAVFLAEPGTDDYLFPTAGVPVQLENYNLQYHVLNAPVITLVKVTDFPPRWVTQFNIGLQRGSAHTNSLMATQRRLDTFLRQYPIDRRLLGAAGFFDA